MRSEGEAILRCRHTGSAAGAGTYRSIKSHAVVGNADLRRDFVFIQVRGDQRKREIAEAADAEPIAGVEIDSARPELADVGEQVLNVPGLSQDAAVGIAMDTAAGGRIARDAALDKGEVGLRLLNGIVDLDVEPVDQEAQPRDHSRLQGDAEREGVGLFRLQIRIAADEAVVLIRRIVIDEAVLRGRHVGSGALRRREGGCRSRAGVDGSV